MGEMWLKNNNRRGLSLSSFNANTPRTQRRMLAWQGQPPPDPRQASESQSEDSEDEDLDRCPPEVSLSLRSAADAAAAAVLEAPVYSSEE